MMGRKGNLPTARMVTMGKSESTGSMGLGKRRVKGGLESLSTDDDRNLLRPSTLHQLTSLRQRAVPSTLHITPDLASQVVKDYLLPLFQHPPKSSNSHYRKNPLSQRSNTSTSVESLTGSVYGELKLSDQLRSELEEVRRELKDRTKCMKEAEQVKVSACEETERLRSRVNELESDCRLLSLNLTQAEKRQQQHSQSMSQLQSSLQMYMDLYTVCDEEKKQLSSALHEEKARSDKLKNRATELEQGNAVIKMECDIMGERLKGLYKAMDCLLGQQGDAQVMKGEMLAAAEVMRELLQFATATAQSLDQSLKERDASRADCIEISSYRTELHGEKDRLVQLTRERITALSTDLSTAKEQIVTLQNDLSKAEKHFKDLEDEHNRLREKMKQSRLKRKQHGESEVKVCRWCQKEFTESENFNWSCRTHTSEFGDDEMYWCCGKTSKEAPGCQTRKHESKDDDEEDAQERAEQEKMRAASWRCSSCKEIGHRPADCPKDPNLRSNLDLTQELKRLVELKERKKMESNGMELQQTVLQLFEDRFGDYGFGKTNIESSFSESVDSRSMENGLEHGKKQFFQDVMQLKDKTPFDDSLNLVRIPQMLEPEKVLTRAISWKLRGKSREETSVPSSLPIIVTTPQSGEAPLTKQLTLAQLLRKNASPTPSE